MTTDMTEKGLEDLIVAAMTGKTSPAGSGGDLAERPAVFGPGWTLGEARDYNREYAIDLFKQYSDNESFRRWLTEKIFDLTYESPAGSPHV